MPWKTFGQPSRLSLCTDGNTAFVIVSFLIRLGRSTICLSEEGIKLSMEQNNITWSHYKFYKQYTWVQQLLDMPEYRITWAKTKWKSLKAIMANVAIYILPSFPADSASSPGWFSSFFGGCLVSLHGPTGWLRWKHIFPTRSSLW